MSYGVLEYSTSTCSTCATEIVTGPFATRISYGILWGTWYEYLLRTPEYEYVILLVVPGYVTSSLPGSTGVLRTLLRVLRTRVH
jgi:hypothetical protein